MRVAFSNIAWNTGSNSPGELEMTLRTSEVAVCCSSDSATRGTLLQFVEEPRVLDRDDRLLGEGLYQLDLLIGKTPELFPVNADDADRLASSDQGQPKVADAGISPAEQPGGVLWVGQRSR